MECYKCGYDGEFNQDLKANGEVVCYCPNCGEIIEEYDENNDVNIRRFNQKIKSVNSQNFVEQKNENAIYTNYDVKYTNIKSQSSDLKVFNIIVLIVAFLVYLFIPVTEIEISDDKIHQSLFEFLGATPTFRVLTVCMFLSLAFQIHEMSMHKKNSATGIVLMILSCLYLFTYLANNKVPQDTIPTYYIVTIVILILLIISIIINIFILKNE